MALSMASSATLDGETLVPSPPLYVAPAEATLDERWDAWRARGAAHDRKVVLRARIALPIAVAVGASIYALFVR
jgi:hypothetical protein